LAELQLLVPQGSNPRGPLPAPSTHAGLLRRRGSSAGDEEFSSDWGQFSQPLPLWQDARDFGLSVGVAQSSWAARGAFGLLSIARHADRLTPAEINMLTLQTNWLANLSHSLMSRFMVPKLSPAAGVTLTAREREVLCWTAEGKTACEIGQILSISERTVNFHVNNILEKLGATNKVQAVVKAISAGLIEAP
ncbi:LuxR C-terminal-related transcriptional regulator, partial [Burkholderia sp.]|uniref:LuxR C-terminal-related transcriptional regulator n=1 Tax=Burkholderia sp. TaxID=36773 RepID=UPI00258E82A3